MIKRILIAVFFNWLLVSTASAQQTNSSNFEFGVTGGYNISNITNPNNYYYSTRQEHGFNLGLSATYAALDNFGFKIKFFYDQKGYGGLNPNLILGGSGPATFTSYDYRLNYLTVPLLFDLSFGNTINFYVDAGPYAGFLLNAADINNHTNLQNVYNGTDWGVALGLGVRFPVSSHTKLFIEFDGQYGLTNILKNVNTINGNFENSRSAFNIGLNFK